MKRFLITTIAVVLLAGCGESPQSTPLSEAKPAEPVAKAPEISILKAAKSGNIEAVKQHIAAGTDVNAKTNAGMTPLSLANVFDRTEIADLLRKHGGKTKSELIFER